MLRETPGALVLLVRTKALGVFLISRLTNDVLPDVVSIQIDKDECLSATGIVICRYEEEIHTKNKTYGNKMSSRLPVISGREIVAVLARIGFREVSGRGKGSHMFVYRDDPPKGITVPDHKEIGRGLLRSIIRQADLTVDEFLKLL